MEAGDKAIGRLLVNLLISWSPLNTL